MNTNSARQIDAWKKSLVTVFDSAGYIEGTIELGEGPLRSLFCEGFVLAGKIQTDGTQHVMTAGGREIKIHSKSLGRALRKRAKQHQWERNSFLRSDTTRRIMAEMAGLNKNVFQAVAVMNASIGIAESSSNASEIYTLMTPGEYHRFPGGFGGCGLYSADQ